MGAGVSTSGAAKKKAKGGPSKGRERYSAPAEEPRQSFMSALVGGAAKVGTVGSLAPGVGLVNGVSQAECIKPSVGEEQPAHCARCPTHNSSSGSRRLVVVVVVVVVLTGVLTCKYNVKCQPYDKAYAASQKRRGGDGWGIKQKNRHYIDDNYNTVAEVAQALKARGLDDCNLIVGIDFTKSNEWTGKKAFGT
jgi:hypothetical protein